VVRTLAGVSGSPDSDADNKAASNARVCPNTLLTVWRARAQEMSTAQRHEGRPRQLGRRRWEASGERRRRRAGPRAAPRHAKQPVPVPDRRRSIDTTRRRRRRVRGWGPTDGRGRAGLKLRCSDATHANDPTIVVVFAWQWQAQAQGGAAGDSANG
jgi:hypothetical protein